MVLLSLATPDSSTSYSILSRSCIAFYKGKEILSSLGEHQSKLEKLFSFWSFKSFALPAYQYKEEKEKVHQLLGDSAFGKCDFYSWNQRIISGTIRTMEFHCINANVQICGPCLVLIQYLKLMQKYYNMNIGEF